MGCLRAGRESSSTSGCLFGRRVLLEEAAVTQDGRRGGQGGGGGAKVGMCRCSQALIPRVLTVTKGGNRRVMGLS